MTETMTSAGLDVHARSIDAAAICVATGELTRRRFSGAPEPVLDWLKGLTGPVHACYEAGPTDLASTAPPRRRGSAWT